MTIRRTEIATNVVAFLTVAVVAYVWACPIRCALQSDAAWVGLVAVLAGAFAAAIKVDEKWFSPGVLAAALATLLIIGAAGRLPADCCNECFARDGDQLAVAATLIAGEEAIVMGPNLGRVDEVFHPRATVSDGSSGAIEDVHAHYESMLHRLEFLTLSHGSPNLVGRANPNEYRVSTESFGTFHARDGGQVTPFQHLDLWTIARTHPCGCWKIQAFTFNVRR